MKGSCQGDLRKGFSWGDLPPVSSFPHYGSWSVLLAPPFVAPCVVLKQGQGASSHALGFLPHSTLRFCLMRLPYARFPLHSKSQRNPLCFMDYPALVFSVIATETDSGNKTQLFNTICELLPINIDKCQFLRERAVCGNYMEMTVKT